ncbi:MAG TPA: hypothetical protein VGQ99_19060 [Tepidisphaeraceae bacterium]|jgi:hypothetical protein|nr:hypothetical protein [Tepidisphaeraceae bacterium]
MIKSRWPSISFFAIAVAFLGASLRGRDWLYKEWAIQLLHGATLGIILAIACSRIVDRSTWQRALTITILCLAAGTQFYLLFTERPASATNVKWSPKGPHVPDLGPDIPRLGEAGILFKSDKRLALQKEQQGLRQRIEQLEQEANNSSAPWIKGEFEKEIYTARYRVGEIDSIFHATTFQKILLVVLPLMLVAVIIGQRLRMIVLPLMLAAWLALGIWVIRATPNPFIDVFVFQQESADALLHGHNPYAMTFTNIYGDGIAVYAPELQKNGRVDFGFPYAPFSLLMIIPGYLVGDHRYAQLFALAIAAALIAFSRPGRTATLAAILLLTTSRVFMVIELGWTEPLVILWLAATVWCACRRPKWVPYALGLLLASKQYTIFIPPLAALLVMLKFTWRAYFILLLKACLVAAIVSLPIILWNLPAFLRSAVTLQLKQPLREDALSYLLYYYWHYDKEGAKAIASWLPFAGAAVMTALSLWLWPRNAGGFAGAIAIVFFAFFALNRQAFCNYYFLVIGAMCCAIAGLDCSAPPLPGAQEQPDPKTPAKPAVGELVEMALP